MTSGIYAIVGPGGKCYVGQSHDVWRRLRGHEESLIEGTHGTEELQKDWNAYPRYHFAFVALEATQKLDEREQYWCGRLSAASDGHNFLFGNLCRLRWNPGKHKERIAVSRRTLKRLWNDPEFAKERKRQIRKHWADPKNRRKQSRKIYAAWESTKKRKQFGKRMKKLWEGDVERRQKVARGVSDWWKNPPNEKARKTQARWKEQHRTQAFAQWSPGGSLYHLRRH